MCEPWTVSSGLWAWKWTCYYWALYQPPFWFFRLRQVFLPTADSHEFVVLLPPQCWDDSHGQDRLGVLNRSRRLGIQISAKSSCLPRKQEALVSISHTEKNSKTTDFFARHSAMCFHLHGLRPNGLLIQTCLKPFPHIHTHYEFSTYIFYLKWVSQPYWKCTCKCYRQPSRAACVYTGTWVTENSPRLDFASLTVNMNYRCVLGTLVFGEER